MAGALCLCCAFEVFEFVIARAMTTLRGMCYTLGMYRMRKETERPRWVELYGDYERDLRDGKVGYNFTIRVARGVPPLSQILPEAPAPILTPLGMALKTAFVQNFLGRVDNTFWLNSFVIMPDHLHVLIWVNQPLKRSILQYLVRALLFTARQLEKAFGLSELWQLPGHLFQCYSWEIVEQKRAYNEANVARWKMDHYRPTDSHPHMLTHPKLDPRYNWEGYGELSLLDGHDFLPCYISHTASEAAIAHFTRLAITLTRAGWGLIGGFVSPQERALLKAVREVTSPRILHLAATRLKDEKVSAQLAHALYQGRFLRLTTAEGEERCTRERCVFHNLWAETFCGDWRANVEAFFAAQRPTALQQANLHRFLYTWKSPRAMK